MLDKVTKVITHFFGIIAGSLSGISAILIAIGYLAERSHLKMLGFTSIPVDLNQYLYTGANLLGVLPVIIILQSIEFFLEPFSLLILFIIIMFWLSMRNQKLKDLGDKMLTHTQRIIAKFKIFFLIIFVFVQIFSLSWMVQAVLVENLLFSQNPTSTQQGFTFLNTNANIDYLKQLLVSKDNLVSNDNLVSKFNFVSKDNPEKDKLSRYFTLLFLITLLIGLVIRYLTLSGKENPSGMSFQLKICLVINFLLFATHVILIPRNYGVLLLDNKYQEVKVQFKSREQLASVLEDKKSLKENTSPPILVNKIRDQSLEMESIPFKYNLESSPKVFTDPDGDILTYSATSDKPDVVGIEIDKTFLAISPIQKGKALITIEAFDSEGLKESTSLNIHVEDEINLWGLEEANPISPKTLIVGEMPYMRDLMAEPSVFRLLDEEPVLLTFQANSSATDVASVEITGNKLTVQPISQGSAMITISANDGYGHLVASEFKVVVLEQKLKSPVDDSLLLLYQSSNVFFLYSKLEKRIWYVRSEDIESMVYYGLAEVF